MSGLSIRLTHKVMAIGLFGLLGLVAFGAIYEIGSLSQDASREIANRARAIADLDKQHCVRRMVGVILTSPSHDGYIGFRIRKKA